MHGRSVALRRWAVPADSGPGTTNGHECLARRGRLRGDSLLPCRRACRWRESQNEHARNTNWSASRAAVDGVLRRSIRVDHSVSDWCSVRGSPVDLRATTTPALRPAVSASLQRCVSIRVHSWFNPTPEPAGAISEAPGVVRTRTLSLFMRAHSWFCESPGARPARQKGACFVHSRIASASSRSPT